MIMQPPPTSRAWVEIDLAQLRRNFQLIRAGSASQQNRLRFVSVVKDDGYGHGAVEVARAAVEAGAVFLAVSNVAEALALREAGMESRILIFGERHEDELAICLEQNFTITSGKLEVLERFSQMAAVRKIVSPVHIKVDSGMSRYGVRWTEAMPLLASAARLPGVSLEGIMSHFAMSDEADKSFAQTQLSRFQNVLTEAEKAGIAFRYRHICNSGGFLDLQPAHYELVRLGILPLGVYPSKVCRRIPGIEPVMRIKARIASIKLLDKGDVVGYGMRYTAPGPTRVAVLPLGYGDGFPRVRNQGHVLIHGKKAPLIGGVSMDAITVDITSVPEAQAWDLATVLGRDGAEEISIHDIATLKNSVSYDAMVGWRSRLPRVYTGQ